MSLKDMNRGRLGIVGVCLTALLAAGCCTPREEAALFRRKNPEEAKHYEVLEPASLHVLLTYEHRSLRHLQALLSGVERRKDRPEELEKYLRSVRKKVAALEELVNSEYETIRKLVEKEGGTVYYYELCRIEEDEDETRVVVDSGLMVIKDGRIVYRASL